MNASETMLGGLALMSLHAGALFTFDAKGRMVETNEPEPERAPRLYLGISEEGIVLHYRDDLSREVVRSIDRFIDGIIERPEPHQLPALVIHMGNLLEADGPLVTMNEGPAWRFPETIPTSPGVVAIGPDTIGLLNAHFPDTAAHLAAQAPCFAIVEDGVAVSACYSARNASLVAEAGVETIPARRGHGLAPRVVAAWAQAVRDEERVPLYSASGTNSASRAVASTLGLEMYGLDFSMT